MVTIADVARHAGVSTSTVSYVFSGKRTISAATRRRVERSVIELGYHPNAGARALAGRRSYVLALVVPLRTDVYVPIMMEIAVSVTIQARRHGYDTLLITNGEGPEGVQRVAASGLADGVILMDVQLGDARIPLVRGQRTQAALIGLPDDPSGLSCVDHDFATADALCADHLANHGHHEIAFIGYGPGIYQRHAAYAERTLAGFRERAAQRGLRFLHRPCEGTYESTAGTFTRILGDRPGTTGFVVQNEAAIGPLLTQPAANQRTHRPRGRLRRRPVPGTPGRTVRADPHRRDRPGQETRPSGRRTAHAPDDRGRTRRTTARRTRPADTDPDRRPEHRPRAAVAPAPARTRPTAPARCRSSAPAAAGLPRPRT
ncbi:hypothetical protein GCM10010339_78070 [Streptomyces alanosinicus]|uniref:HTH lacI-type domain-containing protein n=1 Tax=Streptomyces alanosinicus TaxID=68171 RepID=A0A918YQG4_9ACTN|nr:hypothetical protein GCM10010339_78070 [Streptomyces alanosinicus]